MIRPDQPGNTSSLELICQRGVEVELLTLMRKRHCPVLVETYQGRSPSGVYASPTARPVEVTLALREKGWVPYRVWFEQQEDLWVAKVIDWGQAA
jgi:hypothetical protein